MSPRRKDEEPGFEEQLSALDRIVEELESGELSLEDSLARYQDGVSRLKRCYGLLQAAERKVKLLVRDESGELVERPFSGEDS